MIHFNAIFMDFPLQTIYFGIPPFMETPKSQGPHGPSLWCAADEEFDALKKSASGSQTKSWVWIGWTFWLS